MSYTRLLYHIVFRTKHGKNTIPEQHEKELYAYIMGIINNKKSKLYRIGGTENHIHLLVDIHTTFAVSDFMKELKESIRANGWQKIIIFQILKVGLLALPLLATV